MHLDSNFSHLFLLCKLFSYSFFLLFYFSFDSQKGYIVLFLYNPISILWIFFQIVPIGYSREHQ